MSAGERTITIEIRGEERVRALENLRAELEARGVLFEDALNALIGAALALPVDELVERLGKHAAPGGVAH